MAEASCEHLGGQTLCLQFTLDQFHDHGIRAGQPLRIALRASRIQAFAATGAKR